MKNIEFQADLIDAPSMTKVIADIRPEEIYNFAAQPHVQVMSKKLFHFPCNSENGQTLRPAFSLAKETLY